jgi:HlyD family secretion protein
VKLNETQLGYTTLYSPISGVVLVRSGEVGEVVNPGTSILTMADIENVWLKAYIPETDLTKVKWGQEVIVTTDPHFKTMEEEIFGPVLSAVRFKDETDAIANQQQR